VDAQSTGACLSLHSLEKSLPSALKKGAVK